MGKTKKRFVDKDDEVSIHRSCKYIGSFAINMMKAEERQTLMNERLEELKNVKKGIPVILQVATNGIKVLDENENAVKMAHAIMRIAFSTCSVNTRLFSYVAKSSSSSHDPSIIQAHVFKTKKGSHAQQLSQLVSKAFKITFAMQTVKRRSKLDSFESNAKLVKETSIAVKRRWAKKEIARGHEYAEHAEHARKTHPLAMLPGPSDPIDDGMLLSVGGRPRNSSNTDFDNQRMRQGPAESAAATGVSQKLVDAQINTVGSNSPVIGTPSNESARGMPHVVDIQADLSNEVSTSDSRITSTAQGAEKSWDSTTTHDIIESIPPFTSATQPAQTTPQLQVESLHRDVSGRSQNKDYLPQDIYENVDIIVSVQDKKTEEASEELYINTIASSSPENFYQPLEHPNGATDQAADQGNQPNSIDKEAVANGVEEVAESRVKSDEESGDDDMYSNVEELKQGQCQLISTDRAVLENSYWYQPGIPREIAEEMLQVAMVGTFFIRESTSNPGSFALSMRVPNSVKESGIANILIEKEENGNFRMPGLKSSFPTLTMLVAYYASYQDELPVKLRLEYSEATSVAANLDNVDGAPTGNDEAAANGEVFAKSPEEEAVGMIDAVLPNDPDFTQYESCEPILNELNAQ